MGRGFLKRKNKIKREYLGNAIKEIERLTAENKALKEDPESIIGQFIGQFNDVVSQNQRLSTLACAMIEKNGGKVQISRDQIEVFRGKRLSINIETPEGSAAENLETAAEYVFTYKATEASPAPVTMTPTEGTVTPVEIPPCTDPNCALPKDLKHTHSAPLTPGKTVLVPDVPNVDEPQSGLVATVPSALEDAVVNDATVENGFIQEVDPTTLNGDPTMQGRLLSLL